MSTPWDYLETSPRSAKATTTSMPEKLQKAWNKAIFVDSPPTNATSTVTDAEASRSAKTAPACPNIMDIASTPTPAQESCKDCGAESRICSLSRDLYQQLPKGSRGRLWKSKLVHGIWFFQVPNGVLHVGASFTEVVEKMNAEATRRGRDAVV